MRLSQAIQRTTLTKRWSTSTRNLRTLTWYPFCATKPLFPMGIGWCDQGGTFLGWDQFKINACKFQLLCFQSHCFFDFFWAQSEAVGILRGEGVSEDFAAGNQDEVISISSIWLFWFPGPQTSNCSLGTPACPSKPWRIFVANIPSTVCNYFTCDIIQKLTSPTRPDKRKWCVLNVVGAKWILSKCAKCTNATAEIRLSYYLSKLHAVSIMQCDWDLWKHQGCKGDLTCSWRQAHAEFLKNHSHRAALAVCKLHGHSHSSWHTIAWRSFSKVSWRTSSLKKSLEKSPLWRCLALRKYPNHWLEEQFFKL